MVLRDGDGVPRQPPARADDSYREIRGGSLSATRREGGFFCAGADRRGMGSVSVYWWVALGSALGGMARYGCSGLVATRYGEQFPWGTLVVNVVGSFVIGFFAASAG